MYTFIRTGHLGVREVRKDGIFAGYARISKAPYTYRGKVCKIYAVTKYGMGVKGTLRFCLEYLS